LQSKFPHNDLYFQAEVYEAMFSWDPMVKASYIDLLVKEFIGGDRRLLALEVCSGTGRVAEGLQRLGYKVSCLDISYAMCCYSHRVRGLESITADGGAIPLRGCSVDFAYSMLATFNHFVGYESLLERLIDVYRVLKCNGVYIADAVVAPPGCIGVCEEWDVNYKGRKCRARWIVESVEGQTYTEVLELTCNDRVIVKSRSKLYAPKANEILNLARKVGFINVKMLKPFTLEKASSKGRTFIVFIK